jgi:hypothetical protein
MMRNLMRYAAELEGAGARALPPVETWKPTRCGEIDIVIKADGTWLHEGTPILRARLVRLFSTILRRDGDDYFLITPVEKMKITVEDAPFAAVLMTAEGEGRKQRLVFSTNVGDQAMLGPDHTLVMRTCPTRGDAAPYLNIRRNLEARVARAVFYDLVALGERRQMGAGEMFGVWSAGVFFPLGPADETDG